jgi:ubiquinol-cytochrome c reductase cytochrome b subunit
MILYVLPFYGNNKFKSLSFNPVSKRMFWNLVVIVILLTWIGARPVEDPYVITGQILTGLYFIYFLVVPQIKKKKLYAS